MTSPTPIPASPAGSGKILPFFRWALFCLIFVGLPTVMMGFARYFNREGRQIAHQDEARAILQTCLASIGKRYEPRVYLLDRLQRIRQAVLPTNPQPGRDEASQTTIQSVHTDVFALQGQELLDTFPSLFGTLGLLQPFTAPIFLTGEAPDDRVGEILINLFCLKTTNPLIERLKLWENAQSYLGPMSRLRGSVGRLTRAKFRRPDHRPHP
jgi:hypothetical protein